MKLLRGATLALLVLAPPVGAGAEGNDVAYCAKLTDLMNTYLGGDMRCGGCSRSRAVGRWS